MYRHLGRARRVLGLAALLAAAGLAGCSSDSAPARLASGKELAAKSDHNAASIQFKAALQIDPSNGEARLLLGQSLLAMGDPVTAAAELSRALDAKLPANDVLPPLAKALLQAGDYRKLVTTYGEINLDNKASQAALKSSVASAWGALGDRAKTEAAVKAAIDAASDYAPARLLKARVLGGQGKFDEAAAIVEQVLAADPRSFEAWMLRGEIQDFSKKDLKAAEESWRKALSIEKSHVPAHFSIIASKIRQRDVPAAKAQADQLRAVLPNHPLTVLIDAQLAYLSAEYEKSRDNLQKLLRVFPDHPQVLVLAGATEAQMGSVVQAAAYFGKALQQNPQLEVARRNLAESEIRLGQFAKALTTLKPLLTADPPNAEALSLAGEAELRAGNATGAEVYYQRAAAADPNNVKARTAAAMTRLWRGDATAALSELQDLARKTKDTHADEALLAARMKRREYDAALVVVDAMAKKQPGKASTQEFRGRVLTAKQDIPGARAAFEAALKLDPAQFSSVVGLANLDLVEHKPEQAIERVQAAIKASPKNYVAISVLADLKARNGGSIDEVKKLLADAISASPTSADPRLQLIEFLLRKRQFKDALVAAQDAVAALPSDAKVLEAVGAAQMQAGDVEQAATTFRKLASITPNVARPYLLLAELYANAGKREQAEAAVNKALELEPNNGATQAALVSTLVNTSRQGNALDYTRRLRQSKPDSPIGYLLEAAVQTRRKDTNAAAAVLKEGVARTRSSDLAGKLYTLYIQANRPAEAESFGASWMKQNPQDASFEYLLAVTDIAQNRMKPAEERLRRVLAAYPSNALALNNMAWVLLSTGKPGAVEYAQRAVDMLPDRPALMDTLALALAAEKKLPQAVEVQRKAVDMAPGDHALRLNLAKLALQAGDKAMARKELQQLQQAGNAFAGQAEVGKLMQGL